MGMLYTRDLSRHVRCAAVALIAASVTGCGIASSPCTSTPGRTAYLEFFTPLTAKAGSGPLTIKVYGVNFACGAETTWNGKALSSTVVSSTEMTAVIPESDLAEKTAASINVENPGQTPPQGGITFTVD